MESRPDTLVVLATVVASVLLVLEYLYLERESAACCSSMLVLRANPSYKKCLCVRAQVLLVPVQAQAQEPTRTEGAPSTSSTGRAHCSCILNSLPSLAVGLRKRGGFPPSSTSITSLLLLVLVQIYTQGRPSLVATHDNACIVLAGIRNNNIFKKFILLSHIYFSAIPISARRNSVNVTFVDLLCDVFQTIIFSVNTTYILPISVSWKDSV